MASFKQNVIEQILECPICMETFVKPKVLPCQHSFCLECLYKTYHDNGTLSQTSQLMCPICREVYQLKRPKSGRMLQVDDLNARLQNHFVLTALLDAREQQQNLPRTKSSVRRNVSICRRDKPLVMAKCFLCKKERKWQCVTCDKGFCNNCVAQHFDQKPNHEIFDLDSQLQCEIKNSTQRKKKVPNTIVEEREESPQISNQSLNDYLKRIVESNFVISKCIVADLSSCEVISQYSNDESQNSVVYSKDDIKRICNNFDSASEILEKGLYLESRKFVVTLIDKNFIFAKYKNSGVFALKTHKSIVLTFFSGDIRESVLARQSIERTGSYLSKNGF